jgi:hypothetical protein
MRLERTKLPLLLASLLLLAACTQTDSDSDPTRVFAYAFSMQSPPSGVVARNGYRLKRGTTSIWRLQLSGPAAKQFVAQRWPDLTAAIRRSFVQGSQTPWFAPGRDVKYVTLVSPSDPGVMVMMTVDSDDVFIAYDASQ